MSLNNIIIPVTYDGEDYQNSTLVAHLIRCSPSLGSVPIPLDSLYKNFTMFMKDGTENSTARIDFKKIDNMWRHSSDDSVVADKLRYDSFVDYVNNMHTTDVSNFLLNCSIKPGQLQNDTKVKRIHCDYTGINYLGYLEYINPQDTELMQFSNVLNELQMDKLLEKYYDGAAPPLNLYNSDNFCKSVLESIAAHQGQAVNIEAAMDFFVGQWAVTIRDAITYGINEVMMSGYDKPVEIKYVNIALPKNNVISINMHNLLSDDYTTSKRIIELLYHRLSLEFDERPFKAWHDYMFAANHTGDMQVQNIISKMAAGEPQERFALSYYLSNK